MFINPLYAQLNILSSTNEKVFKALLRESVESVWKAVLSGYQQINPNPRTDMPDRVSSIIFGRFLVILVGALCDKQGDNEPACHVQGAQDWILNSIGHQTDNS